LLEKFIKKTEEQGEEIVVAAGNNALQEISKWKINNN
jgi:hypothetical protein